MKKIFVLFLFVAFSFAVSAQDAYVTKPKNFSGWGTAADTLTASTSFTYTVSVKTAELLNYSVQLGTDSVSGTPAFTAYLQTSMNGSNWTNLDTITHTGGADKYEFFAPTTTTAGNLYYRVIITATAAAQKSELHVYWTFRRTY